MEQLFCTYIYNFTLVSQQFITALGWSRLLLYARKLPVSFSLNLGNESAKKHQISSRVWREFEGLFPRSQNFNQLYQLTWEFLVIAGFATQVFENLNRRQTYTLTVVKSLTMAHSSQLCNSALWNRDSSDSHCPKRISGCPGSTLWLWPTHSSRFCLPTLWTEIDIEEMWISQLQLQVRQHSYQRSNRLIHLLLQPPCLWCFEFPSTLKEKRATTGR